MYPRRSEPMTFSVLARVLVSETERYQSVQVEGRCRSVGRSSDAIERSAR